MIPGRRGKWSVVGVPGVRFHGLNVGRWMGETMHNGFCIVDGIDDLMTGRWTFVLRLDFPRYFGLYVWTECMHASDYTCTCNGVYGCLSGVVVWGRGAKEAADVRTAPSVQSSAPKTPMY